MTCGLDRAVAVAAVVTALVTLAAATAGAHPLAPSSLHIDEQAPGVATVRLETPDGARLTPVWPVDCAARPHAAEVSDGVRIERFDLACGGRSLAGATFGLDGLADRDTIALVRARLAAGGVVREVLGPSRPRVTLPASTPWPRVFVDHLRLGFAHLLAGLDHVLFVLGLLLVVPGLRERVLVLTAFTAGHSATLVLAALGVVAVPSAPVEILIALTLVAVAMRALDPPRRAAPAGRAAWLLAVGFGAIHGLGFAGALAGAGLGGADLALALAAFNVGIELGQLVLVVSFVALAAIASRLATSVTLAAAPALRAVVAHVIGGLATMWFLERTWSALS